MGLRLTILKSEKLKIIFSMLIIFSLLLSTFMSVNAGLFGEKIKKISNNELKEIKVELNLSKDPNFYSYTDSMLKEALDKEINSQETPGLTFGSFVLNALYEEKLVEMCYPNFNDKKSSLFFSKLADNLSNWQKNFASKTTKIALQGVIEAYLKMPKLGMGTSTLFLAIDLVQINVAIAKLVDVVRNRALFYYLFNRSQGDSHKTAWGEGIPPLYDNWQIESFFQSLWNKYGEAILSDNLDNFKKEQHEFLRILILKALNRPPNPPTNMIQLKSDGKTILKIGKTTTEKTVILKAKVSDPDGNKARLQIELRRLDEYGGQFDEDTGGLKQSDLLEDNSEIMIPIYELADDDYHWRARAIDEHGLASEWISFGGNLDSAVDFTLGQEVVAPIITSPLKITPSLPYYVGDTINAEFTITNQGKLPIDFSVLTIGGRDPDNHVSDFTIRQNITLEPSEPYNYQGTLTLNKVGDYHFFCTYQTPDGNWNTNVDLGSGLADEDRTEEIVVIARESEDTPSVSLGYPEKILPVKPRIIGKPAPGYYISQILAKPDEIKIFGNYSKINNLEFLETIPIDVSGITKTLSVKVPPALNEGLNIVEGKTTLIEVTIQVKEALVQKTLPDEEEVTEASSSKDYFPLDEGRRWEYQVYVNEKEGLYLGLESKISGKQVCIILPQRELKGKRVTPMQMENIHGGSVYTRFLFYVKDQNSIYEFASQKPEDVEPKIIHDDIIKYPIKVGNSWQEMEISSLEPRISIPINTTIESIDEVVTVPAGTFKECLKIKSTGFAEKVFGEEQVWPPKENVKVEKERYDWFAPNVGHIKIILKEKKTYSGGAIGITLSDYIEVIMQLETFK